MLKLKAVHVVGHLPESVQSYIWLTLATSQSDMDLLCPITAITGRGHTGPRGVMVGRLLREKALGP